MVSSWVASIAWSRFSRTLARSRPTKIPLFDKPTTTGSGSTYRPNLPFTAAQQGWAVGPLLEGAPPRIGPSPDGPSLDGFNLRARHSNSNVSRYTLRPDEYPP